MQQESGFFIKATCGFVSIVRVFFFLTLNRNKLCSVSQPANMSKVLVLSVLVVAVCVGAALSQETEEEGAGGSAWEKMKKAWKGMVTSVRKMWDDFTEEVKARASDMKDYSKEMVDTIRSKMNEIIDSMRDATPAEKEDMKKYVERLELEAS